MGESVNDDQSAFAAAGTAGAGGADSAGGAAGEGSGGEAGTPSDGPGASPIISGGGAAGAGGEDNGGAAGAPPVCDAGQKLCEEGCEEMTPENGCGSYGCTPCNTPPANSQAICNGSLCDFQCLPGFKQDGFSCVPTGGGGSGGSGSGGSGGTGGASGGSGGTGGSSSMCVAPCNPSDSTSQFLCVAACVSKGGVGLCAPALNCCICG